MIQSRIQPSYLTNVCQINYKKCIKIEKMDLCGHLMHECHGTRNFTLPSPARPVRPSQISSLSFTDEENRINLRRCKKKKFYDANICRHLCSRSLVLQSTKKKAFTKCERICFQLTRSFDFAGAVCPGEKYCSKGCPCMHYDCEKSSVDDQKHIPVWNLANTTEVAASEAEKSNLIYRRSKAKVQ